LLLDIRFRCSW